MASYIGTTAQQAERATIIKAEINYLIEHGTNPKDISISGLRNPSLKNWANKMGIAFDKTQEIDITTR